MLLQVNKISYFRAGGSAELANKGQSWGQNWMIFEDRFYSDLKKLKINIRVVDSEEEKYIREYFS